jgi:hypothetical protein
MRLLQPNRVRLYGPSLAMSNLFGLQAGEQYRTYPKKRGAIPDRLVHSLGRTFIQHPGYCLPSTGPIVFEIYPVNGSPPRRWNSPTGGT